MTQGGGAPPTGASTIPALTAATADRFGDRVAVVDGDVELTYAALLEEARTFGAGLVAAGVEPGDRVAIWAPNSGRWIVALMGLFQAGAVLVPVNTRFKGPEAAPILERSHAKVLITVTDFLGTDHLALLREAEAELPDLQTRVVVDGPVRVLSTGERYVAARRCASNETRRIVSLHARPHDPPVRRQRRPGVRRPARSPPRPR